MRKLKYFFLFLVLIGTVGFLFFESFIKSERVSLAQGEVEMINLSDPVTTGKLSLEEAISRRRSIRSYKDEALSLEEVSNLLWVASGITDPAGKRAAPSAGALYPLDLYLVAGEVEDLVPGIYRYNPGGHSLEMTVKGDKRTALHSVSLMQSSVKNAPISIVLVADYDRITPRYRARAKRYTKIEAGHIGQNIYLQAESLGLGTVAIGAFTDSGVRKVLAVEEDPLYIMPVGKK